VGKLLYFTFFFKIRSQDRLDYGLGAVGFKSR